MSREPILRVAIDAPLSRLFDYLPCAGDAATPGSRVRVPFGRRSRVGLVMATAADSDLPLAKLRRVTSVLDRRPLLSQDDLWLIRFVSDYYHHPVGEVAAAALPALLRQGKPLHPVAHFLSLTTAGATADIDVLARRAPRQAELLQLVRDADTISCTDVESVMPGWRSAAKALAEKSFVEAFAAAEPDHSSGQLANTVQEEGPVLNPDQLAALAQIRGGTGFRVSLLDGVTGSGKTEVYLHLMQSELAAGRQVLVLVPEIGLTPQLVGRFQRRLGVAPVLLHSALTDTARLRAWRAARDGSAPVVLGTRSAVFVPLARAGLIIVDEEHDASLKQQEGLRYSARDLAVARGKQLGVAVVLGSATPSLETLQRCEDAVYSRVCLPVRAGSAVPPRMRLVDLTRHDAADGLSEPAAAAIADTVAAGMQALVFLNRRGFAPTLICSGCGSIADCLRCDARMTVHAGSAVLKCHHCGAERPMTTECADCGALCRPLGHGTERLEEALVRRFPGESIARIDSDSTKRKGAMARALALAVAGETKILVGTQMLSKGHHFPGLALVVIINADQGLFSTDFRGGERLAQSVVQVAGRAGREERQGEVLIQTAFPAHAFWNTLFTGGYAGVAQSVLAERKTAHWPPFTRLALVRAASTARDDAFRFLDAARAFAESRGLSAVRVLGPVSAPMERKAGLYRAQLLLQSGHRGRLHEMLDTLRPSLENSAEARRVRWSIDVDPIELF